MRTVTDGGERTAYSPIRMWSLWGATAVSSVGDGLAYIAFPLAAAAVTDDPRLVAGVLVAQRLPWLLIALGAGALVDRRDRRGAMVAVETLRAMVLGLFAVALAMDLSSLPMLYAAAFIVGAGDTVLTAGVHATLPHLVPRHRLERANGVLFSTQTAGEQFAGPALGGILFAVAAAWPFGADAATFAVSGVLLWLAVPSRSALGGEQPSAMRGAIREGLRHFWSDPLLRMLAGIIAGFAFLQAIVQGVLVLFAMQELGLSAAAYGLFLAFGAIGNVLGGLVAGHAVRALGTSTVVTLAGLSAGLSYVVISSAALGSGLVALAAVALLLEAVAVGVANVATLSLRQRVVPEHLLGRVGNAFLVLVFGSIPLGAIAGGALASAAGLSAAILAAGVIQVGVGAVTWRPLRRRIAERT